MPSFGVEKDLTAQVIGLFGRRTRNVLPGFVVGQKHAVVFSTPALGAIGQSTPATSKIFQSGTISSGSVTGSLEF